MLARTAGKDSRRATKFRGGGSPGESPALARLTRPRHLPASHFPELLERSPPSAAGSAGRPVPHLAGAGAGGMPTVYLAHDLKHDRPVALKLLDPALATSLGPERFQREIRLAARLQHPPHPPGARLRRRRWIALVHHAAGGGGDAAKPPGAGHPASTGRGPADLPGGGPGARLCPPAGHHSPGHQTGKPAADCGRLRAGGRLRHRAGHGSRRGATHRDRPAPSARRRT